MKLLVAIITVLAVASSATAGAWAREEGELFIAFGGNFLLSEGAQKPVHYDPTLYAEYGLSDRMTIGLDMYTADAGEILTAFGFAAFPIGDIEAKNRFMASIALGVRIDPNANPETLMRGGVSWGRGMESGWLAIDASATFGTIDTDFRPKADFTWGQNWSDNWTTTFQLQTGQGITDDFYAKISPSIIYTLRDDIKIHLGGVQALTGDQGYGLKFETWLTF